MKKITVLDLLSLDLKENDDLQLKCIAGRKGLGREITVPHIDRPGLELAGYFDNFAYQRIQIFGRGEFAFLNKMIKENNIASIEKFFTFPFPCCIFPYGATPEKYFIEQAEKARSPILQSPLPSPEFLGRLIRVLENIFAPQQVVHGVFVEVFGIGILIKGKSWVGKSEAALELIERGHSLIADDLVEIKRARGNYLEGRGANTFFGHHMEIRGLGIINITHLFGVGSIRDSEQIQLVINLEPWDPEKIYDRIGTTELTEEILGVHVPCLLIPVKPGRNIPILIETAAKNERLKQMGYYSAREFNRNVMKWLETDSIDDSKE
ncbi:MAG: HPr(Ser) kinase/phosphatase [Spirochaetaceae bacterium]|nr:HPr(Ser) kinase/phosphatase [Spirochaetaceae bacterium]